jgi:CheY-like chemotaxis protein
MSSTSMPTVLHFEDDRLLQVVIADLLEDVGMTAIVGELDRSGAARQVHSLDYDLVLTDMNMPNFDGVDVLEWVRRQRPGTPVVALTGASASQLIRIGCDPAQFASFLFKPADLEVLLNVIDHLLSGRPPAGVDGMPDSPRLPSGPGGRG